MRRGKPEIKRRQRDAGCGYANIRGLKPHGYLQTSRCDEELGNSRTFQKIPQGGQVQKGERNSKTIYGKPTKAGAACST